MRFELTALVAGSLLGLAAANKSPSMLKDSKEVIDVPEMITQTIDGVPASRCPFQSGDGSVLVVNYIGELPNGKVFDHSMREEDILQFQIGTGMVLRGWEVGLKGMCIGETRKITIPSRLGYGSRIGGGGIIPANSALVYTVVLRELKRSGPTYPNPKYFASLSASASSSDLPSTSSSSSSSSSSPSSEAEATETESVDRSMETDPPAKFRDEL